MDDDLDEKKESQPGPAAQRHEQGPRQWRRKEMQRSGSRAVAVSTENVRLYEIFWRNWVSISMWGERRDKSEVSRLSS